jgi:hypothetical protein
MNVFICIILIVQSMINFSEIQYTDLFKQESAASELSFVLYNSMTFAGTISRSSFECF